MSVIFRYGFRDNPRLWLQARPKLGERQVNISQVTSWIEKQLCQEFQVIQIRHCHLTLYVYECVCVCLRARAHTFLLIQWNLALLATFDTIQNHPTFTRRQFMKTNCSTLWRLNCMPSLVQMLYSSLGQPTQGIGFYLSSTGRMNLYVKRSATYETVAKIQYTGCFTTLCHNCRRWFPRSWWGKKFI
jgi:hypothetical protein